MTEKLIGMTIRPIESQLLMIFENGGAYITIPKGSTREETAALLRSLANTINPTIEALFINDPAQLEIAQKGNRARSIPDSWIADPDEDPEQPIEESPEDTEDTK